MIKREWFQKIIVDNISGKGVLVKIEKITGKIKAFLELQRWNYHIGFISTIIGYFLVSAEFNPKEVINLAALIFIFGPLLYGGIYTINDIFDLKYDRINKKKASRPLVANRITIRDAWLFSIFSISLAIIIISALFPKLIVYPFLFLLINLLYSWKLKHILFIDILSNCLTHTLRFHLGMLVAGSKGISFILLTHYLLVLTLGTLRREKDKHDNKESSRPVIKEYKISWFPFLYCIELIGFIVSLTILSKREFLYSISVFFPVLFLIFTYNKFNWLRRFIDSFWL